MKQIKIFLLISMVIFFTACGGGSGIGSTSNTDLNTPPTKLELAISTIQAYADNQSNPEPTI